MFVITDITLSERNKKSELFYGVTTNEKFIFKGLDAAIAINSDVKLYTIAWLL